MKKTNKNLILSLVLVLLLLVVGVTYAFFNYSNNSDTSEIVTGQIYLNYEETNVLTLTNVWPETKAQALARTDEQGVFEFTITGQNTSREDIEYVIKIDEANDVSGKNRISNKFIRIYLESEGEVLVDGEIFNTWDDRVITIATVPAGTTDTITKTYTLRMWIDESLSISDTAPNADYTTSEWNNSYANLRVNVYGKTGGIAKPLATEIEETQAAYLTEADVFGNRYISGTSADITNNYVKFSNKLWRIVGINADGTIKLITESAMTYMPWDSTGNTDYATSEIRTWLNNEFLPTLNEDMIAETTFNYTGISESFEIGEIQMLQDKVGLLSVFDYVGAISLDLATGDYGYMLDNYLLNKTIWWTMTYCTDNEGTWAILADGEVTYGVTEEVEGIRPSINLISDVEFYEGDGSKENPYVIVGEETQGEKYSYNENFATTLSNLTEADVSGTRYVKGLVEDNYVWYSGKLWRIVALNGDGTVKLVTQNAMTSIAWDINGNNNYANSQIRSWLNNEFLPTINEDLIANTTWDYTNGTLTEKVGLLRYDELVMTYDGYPDADVGEATSHLANDYYWWLMTPYTIDNSASSVWGVGDDGAAYWLGAMDAYGGRPSVNLISDIRISGGTGEYGMPYTIEGDKATGESSELLSNRINGEYVKFNNTLYRIVGVETINGKKLTKITMADYNVNKNTIATEVQFGATWDEVGATFTPTSGIGIYLKNWYEGSEVSETSRAMVATAEEDGVVWYQGPTDGTGYDYTLSKTGTPISATIGLPYYGEMFSTQQGAGYEESTRTWLMTKYNASLVWDVGDNGYARWNGATLADGARPSVYLKSNIRLGDTNGDGKVGTGQINSPYELVID